MLEGMFEDVHSQRLDALANYAEATMRAMRAGVHAIGAAYAELAEIKPKHGIKQFDRFLSNRGLDVRICLPRLALVRPRVVGRRLRQGAFHSPAARA